MKRPSVVWVYSILVTFGILFSVIGSIGILSNPYGRMGLPPMMYFAQIFSLILVIPQIIFIALFFLLKKSSLTWLYISFGLGIVLNLIAQQWIAVVIMAVFGWAIWDYISHKKVDGQAVFT
jgi:hypothetical protein